MGQRFSFIRTCPGTGCFPGRARFMSCRGITRSCFGPAATPWRGCSSSRSTKRCRSRSPPIGPWNAPSPDACEKHMNLTDAILRHGRMHPNAPALIEAERTISYRALADLVLRTAGQLAVLGISPGDQVGLCLKDDRQHVVTLLAVLRLGAP